VLLVNINRVKILFGLFGQGVHTLSMSQSFY
jgi:hypothetical protein